MPELRLLTGFPGGELLTRLGPWQILRQDAMAADHMAVDEVLGYRGRPIVRLFRWLGPALSRGFRQPWPAALAFDRLAEAGVELVERPTGGGVAVHGTDLSFSVTVPTEGGTRLHEVMQAVCEATARAVRAVGLPAEAIGDGASRPQVDWCVMSAGSPYAIRVRGRKVGGLAARRYPEAWLIQGSVLVRPLPERMLRLLPAAVADEVQRHALQQAAGCAVEEEALAHQLVGVWGGLCQGSPEVHEAVHAV